MKAVVFFSLTLVIASSWIIAATTVDSSLPVTRSEFPSPLEAKSLLNSSHRHGDWIRVQSGSKTILAAVDYPDRADKAAVVIITAREQKVTDWLRAVADQVASEGFITVVPDALSTAS